MAARADDDVASRIGEAVRAHRRRLGWSMRALADAIGASQPFVSNVENGRIFPSVEMLLRLSEALGVPSRALLPAQESTVVVGAAHGMALCRKPSQSASRPLVAEAGARLAAFRVELRPGEAEPHSFVHNGEDFVFVVEGHVEVLRESLPALPLSAGDSLWLDGTVPHRLSCPAASAQNAVVLVTAASAPGSASPAASAHPA